jgi:DNA-binding XRE family transcriptional regulator
VRIKLKETRESKNMSVTVLSKLSGVSRQHIYDIENATHVPKITTACKLAKALHVEVTEIFDCN